KTCPQGNEAALECMPNKYVTSCQKTENADNEIAIRIYETAPIRNTICLPTSNTIKNKLSAAVGEDTWQGKFVSMGSVWHILLSAVPIATVMSVIFMFFIRHTAGCFVYILLILAVPSCLALGIYLLAAPSSSVAGVSLN